MAINAQALASMSKDELVALVAQLAANQPGPRKLTYKVGDKGGVCIYGLGRFPVHAYASQWERILEDQENLKAFIKTNDKLLARKPATV